MRNKNNPRLSTMQVIEIVQDYMGLNSLDFGAKQVELEVVVIVPDINDNRVRKMEVSYLGSKYKYVTQDVKADRAILEHQFLQPILDAMRHYENMPQNLMVLVDKGARDLAMAHRIVDLGCSDKIAKESGC